MKKRDVSKRYNIPLEVLNEYESWGLCNAVKVVIGDWQYDEQDLERLSIIMVLHDIGFNNSEIELYMGLLIDEKDTNFDRMKLLDNYRGEKLNEIHFREKQLERIDYLRYEIRKANQ